MKIEIELTEAEIKEAVLDIIAHDYAKALDSDYNTAVKYVTRLLNIFIPPRRDDGRKEML